MDALQKLTVLERAVQGDRPVRRPDALVVTHFRAVEIKLSIGLIADLARERHDRRNLPIESRARANLSVGDHCVVETRNSMRNSKLIVHTESGIPGGCSCLERYIMSQFELQARGWQKAV